MSEALKDSRLFKRQLLHVLDGVGFSEYRFKVNKPPYGGACDVEPRSGFSLTSKFRVSCSNWVDEDLPLTYQIGRAFS